MTSSRDPFEQGGDSFILILFNASDLTAKVTKRRNKEEHEQHRRENEDLG
jgi:hypothetical protein